MTGPEMARELSALVQMDIDAARAYEQAIGGIQVVVIRDQFIRFRQDHERHIDQLSAVIRALAMEPPVYYPESFTALQPVSGVEDILNTMKINEDLINRRYQAAHALGFTPNIGELVFHNYRDEQVHLRFVMEALDRSGTL